MPQRRSTPHEPAAEANSRPHPAGRFAGKVALVTGASDRGIGGAIADRLSEEGAAIVVANRHEPERLMKRLTRRGSGTEFVHCDICVPADVLNLVERCLHNFGQLDILVNNAGVEFAKSIETVTDEEWTSLLEINLHGAIRMTRAVVSHLPTPGGVIINVASALGLGGCPGFSIYSASKAGLIGFTQSLAWELAPRGIRVLGVAPALVPTPMTVKHLDQLTDKAREQIAFHHPLGVGSPHDVASVVAFLASEDARWMTGVTLPLGWAPHYPLPVEHFMDDGGT